MNIQPIGSHARPERDRTIDDAVDTQHPIVVEISQKYSIHPATALLQRALQQGEVVQPKSYVVYI